MNIKKVAIILLFGISITLNVFIWMAYSTQYDENLAYLKIIDRQANSFNAERDVASGIASIADSCLRADKTFDYASEYEKVRSLAKERDRIFAEYESLKHEATK